MSNPETTSNANASVPETIRQLLGLLGNQISDNSNCVVIVNVNINQPAQVHPLAAFPAMTMTCNCTEASSGDKAQENKLSLTVKHDERSCQEAENNCPSSPTEPDSPYPFNEPWDDEIADRESSPIPDEDLLGVPIPRLDDAINEFNRIHGTKVSNLDFAQCNKYYITELPLGALQAEFFAREMGMREKVADRLERHLSVIDDKYRAALRSAHRARSRS